MADPSDHIAELARAAEEFHCAVDDESRIAGMYASLLAVLGLLG